MAPREKNVRNKSSKPATKKPNPRKEAPKSQVEIPTPEPKAAVVSPEELKTQQRLLDIFATTFNDILSSPDLGAVVQEVKQALYNREFSKAFGREDYLDVYAARWSPTRALCYASILKGLSRHLESLTNGSLGNEASVTADEAGGGQDGECTAEMAANDGDSNPLKILSIGGGAAEIVAFASFLSCTSSPDPPSASLSGDITLLDTGPWGPVVSKLQAALTTAPPVSKNASAPAKEDSNSALVPSSQLQSTFTQQDILDLNATALGNLLGPTRLLITLLFTLNELYTSSGIGPTTALLRKLTSCVPADSLLLVVDSPGSYSEASVGKEAKRYPMSWLLDYTLLGADRQSSTKLEGKGAKGEGEAEEEPAKKREERACRWEKVASHDSLWFRMDERLRYPIALENMRYQMHLYRAVARDGGGR
ncbi:hypothetical protein BJ170DRAFT_186534 [Xylariales sp. AK1849]|nr:hypothetical protein BJ170DRAFT_186534 [Xylariales sp. AK1849]